LKRRTPIRLFLAGALLLLTTSPGAASLISNGRFEDAGFTGASYQQLSPGSTAMNPWNVVSGSVEWISTYWAAKDGSYSIDLNGTNYSGSSAGKISQTFATQPGQAYQVSFWMSGNPDDGGSFSEKRIRAGADGLAEEFTVNTASMSRSSMLWTLYSLLFTADDTQATLFFESLNNESNNPGWGPVIDLVTVNAVPIPGAAWLMGAGLIGVVGIRRKYKK
jgi:choice-of-anchor C domain-containing protein